MTAAMLILLAACRVPILRQLIGEDILKAGTHLKEHIQSWKVVLGQPNSPSLDYSLKIICEVDSLLKEEYQSRREGSSRTHLLLDL